jgi:hypothetical protein
MAKIRVYAFASSQPPKDGQLHTPYKATRETIATIPGALIIESSAEDIDETLLDTQGRYYPKR